MKIIPTDIDLTTRKFYKPGKLQTILQEFVNTDAPIVEIQLEPGEYVNVRSAQTCLSQAIKRMGLGVRTCTNEGHLYLVKTQPDAPVVYLGGPSPYPCREGEGGSC